MVQTDITSDINQAMKDIDDTFWRQIPFALASAMNDTMFDARRRIIGPTYDKAFTRRNMQAAKASWFVDKIITGGKNASIFRGFKSGGGTIEVVVRQKALRGRGGNSNFLDYYERHVTGGIKRPIKSQGIAIPTKHAEGFRNSQGSMRAARRPTAMRNKRNVFVAGNGPNRIIMERKKDGTVIPWYILVPNVQISPTFRFYEDGIDTIQRVFSGHFNSRMNRIIRRSRFT